MPTRWYLILCSLIIVITACEPIVIVRELPPDEQQVTFGTPTPLPSPTPSAVVSPTPFPPETPLPTVAPTPIPAYAQPSIELARFGAGVLQDFALSPHDNTLALVTTLGISLRDYTQWQENRFITTETMPHHIILLPDGERIATTDTDHQIYLWRKSDGAQLNVLSGHTQRIADLAASSDGQYLASASFDGTVRLWNLNDGGVATLIESQSWLEAVAFSSTGLLASTDENNNIALWQHGERVNTLSGHSRRVTSLAFSPDGQQLLSGAQDKTVRLWQVADGSLQQTLPTMNHGVTQIAMSPDGTAISAVDRTGLIRVWSNPEGTLRQEIQETRQRINQLVFSPDSQAVLYSGSNILKERQVTDGVLRRSTEAQFTDVNVMAISTHDMIAGGSRSGWIRLWGADGSARQTIKQDGQVSGLAFSPDGSVLVSGSQNNMVSLWRVENGAPLQTLPMPSQVTSLAFSPTGEQLAVGLDDGQVQVWGMNGLTLQHNLQAGNKLIYGLTFSPDGSIVASGGVEVRLWRSSDSTLLRTQTESVGENPQIAFVPDGAAYSISVNNGIHVRDLVSDELQISLTAFEENLTSLAVNPNGQKIAAGDEENVVYVWNRADGTLTQLIEGHRNTISGVGFIANGGTLVSGSLDGTIRLWQVR
ncbi:WD40 repeat domain-containing protein [Anaerolineales bacterium HSG25]|nr:WD40 repeat domain-containing protein [Anaerolineales bacterium HSG25]